MFQCLEWFRKTYVPIHDGKDHETRDIVAAAVGVAGASCCAFAAASAPAAAAAAAVGQTRPPTTSIGICVYLPGHDSSTKNGSIASFHGKCRPGYVPLVLPPPYGVRFEHTKLLCDDLFSCDPALCPTLLFTPPRPLRDDDDDDDYDDDDDDDDVDDDDDDDDDDVDDDDDDIVVLL